MNCNFNAAIKQYAYNELLSHPDDSVRIKSERELCTLYGISRPTVRKALAELEQEGVLIIRHGSGAFTNPAAAKYRQNPTWRRPEPMTKRRRKFCDCNLMRYYGFIPTPDVLR